MALSIGIDLGTTNSCVAMVRDGKARVVQDETGVALHPSVVSFHPDGRVLVGVEAAERRVIDPQNTFYSVKRLIGRDYSDPDVRRVAERYPYTVVEGPKGMPLAQARGKEFTLPEISSMVLGHLRDVVARMTQEPVASVVITVPANFNDVQRSSTKVAGRIAGLDVQRILNEPTAAALAYGYGQGLNERIAVYDFGGGTFDVTILDLRDNVFEVLATAGDMFLGGDDFDARLVDQMVASFLKLHHVDIRDNTIALQRLRGVAEQIKCQLSSRAQVSARIRELEYGPGGKPLDMNFAVTRDAFEQRVIDLIDRSFMVCDEAFRLASMSPAQLDNIILVGGTTRIPLIRQRVAEYFGREPRADINPDEVVAIGAAIQAFALSGHTASRTMSPPQAQRPEELGRPIGTTTDPEELEVPPGQRPGVADVKSTQRGVGLRPPGGAGAYSAQPPAPPRQPAPPVRGAAPRGASPAGAFPGGMPADLPAPAGARPPAGPAAAAFGAGLPEDLPAPRGAHPGFGPGQTKTKQEPAGPGAAAAFGAGLPEDLPAPRGAQPAWGPGPSKQNQAPAGSGAAAAFGAGLPEDLPAPRGAQPGWAPGQAKPGQAAHGPGAAAGHGGGLPEDLPAPRVGGRTFTGTGTGPGPTWPGPAAQSPRPGAAAAFGAGLPDDLPAPRGAGAAPARPGAAGAFPGGLPEDLPAPLGARGQPGVPPASPRGAATGPGAAAAFGGGLPEDLPAPRGAQPGFGPAKQRPGAAPPPGPGAAGAFPGGLPEDLPAPRGAHGGFAPPVSQQVPLGAGAAFGGELPDDLPAPRAQGGGVGSVDLPAPRAGFGPGDLPVPRQAGPSSVDLPAPQYRGAHGSADLPIPQQDGGWYGGGADLPQVAGDAAGIFGGQLPDDLPSPRGVVTGSQGQQRGQFLFDDASRVTEGTSTGGQWSLESAAMTFTEDSVIGSFTEDVKAPASIGRPPPELFGGPPSGLGPAAPPAQARGSATVRGLGVPPTKGSYQPSFQVPSQPPPVQRQSQPAPIEPASDEGEWDLLSVPGAPVPQPQQQHEVAYVESSVSLQRSAPLPPHALAGVQAPGVAPLPAQMLQDLGVSHILIDVTPRTLAVQTVQGYCDPIIERNSPIPIEQSRVFTTSRDDQDTVVIKIAQGESRRVEENTVLGEVTLTGIRPAPRGEVKISVTFEIDTDGIVSVSARDVDTGQQAATRVTVFGGLSDDEVRDLVRRYGR